MHGSPSRQRARLDSGESLRGEDPAWARKRRAAVGLPDEPGKMDFARVAAALSGLSWAEWKARVFAPSGSSGESSSSRLGRSHHRGRMSRSGSLDGSVASHGERSTSRNSHARMRYTPLPMSGSLHSTRSHSTHASDLDVHSESSSSNPDGDFVRTALLCCTSSLWLTLILTTKLRMQVDIGSDPDDW